jgi:phage/plasmid-associated DNA primase
VERDPSIPFPVDCTDDWLAEKIAPDMDLKLRFDYPNGKWHVWDGTRWADDDRGQHMRLVLYALRGLARDLKARLANLSEKEQKKYSTTINKLGNVSTLRAVVSLLESMLAVGTDAFDGESMQLNTPAGMVDLNTGEIFDHDPRWRQGGRAVPAEAGRLRPHGGTSRADAHFRMGAGRQREVSLH